MKYIKQKDKITLIFDREVCHTPIVLYNKIFLSYSYLESNENLIIKTLFKCHSLKIGKRLLKSWNNITALIINDGFGAFPETVSLYYYNLENHYHNLGISKVSNRVWKKYLILAESSPERREKLLVYYTGINAEI